VTRSIFTLLMPLWLISWPALAEPVDLEKLLSQMTLTEKLGQLQMLDGEWSGGYRAEHPQLIREGKLGSTLNVRGSRRVNELQRIALQEARLPIPMLFAFDVIHGHRTIFPIPLAEAASFSLPDVEKAARVAAREATSTGLRWTFAPMVDISRDARWGRVSEGAGEDPYLGSQLAAARVRGFQGQNLAHSESMAACAKHWLAYGACEAGLDYNTVDVSERSLQETYLPPFQAAFGAKCATVMSAFHELNGLPTSGDPLWLRDWLRGRCGFEGVVVSDYYSVDELMGHGSASNESEAARLALSAGVDIEMVSRHYANHVPDLIKTGRLSESIVDESVRRVLRLKQSLGLFEHPYVEEGKEESVLGCSGHRQAAREMAQKSVVLLKNQGLLPLSPKLRKLAVIGPLADDPVSILGSWAADGKPQDTVTLLSGLRAALPGVEVSYSKGCDLNVKGAQGNYDSLPAKATNAGGTNVASSDGVDPRRLAVTPVDSREWRRSLELARKSELVILALGEPSAMSGEAASRTNLGLPGRQLELFEALRATGKPVVVVLFCGRALAIPELAQRTPALLCAWFPGSQGGHALADVLTGKVSPSGRLPVSFPYTVGQMPLYYNRKPTGKKAGEHKYTSKYLDVPTRPLYEFGHGLSYSRFDYGQLQVRPHSGGLAVEATLTNRGARPADQVSLLFLRTPSGAQGIRPVKELKAFQRHTLAVGESRCLHFELSGISNPGKYHLWLGDVETEFVLP
jgi:beta-glucosidase